MNEQELFEVWAGLSDAQKQVINDFICDQCQLDARTVDVCEIVIKENYRIDDDTTIPVYIDGEPKGFTKNDNICFWCGWCHDRFVVSKSPVSEDFALLHHIIDNHLNDLLKPHHRCPVCAQEPAGVTDAPLSGKDVYVCENGHYFGEVE